MPIQHCVRPFWMDKRGGMEYVPNCRNKCEVSQVLTAKFQAPSKFQWQISSGSIKLCHHLGEVSYKSSQTILLSLICTLFIVHSVQLTGITTATNWHFHIMILFNDWKPVLELPVTLLSFHANPQLTKLCFCLTSYWLVKLEHYCS